MSDTPPPSGPGWTVRQLPIEFQVAAYDPEGVVYAGCFNTISASRDGGETFDVIARFENEREVGATLLYRDRGGCLYFSTRELGRLYASRDGGASFDVVCEGFDGSIRGFDQNRDGRLFAGVYSRHGPARLLSSADGEYWSPIAQWDARHVHDVRINPHNDWLYVVVGEGTPRRTPESHSVYRSMDGGQSFVRVVAPAERGRPRPLFLPVNFRGDRVLLGTDHTEGGNGIHGFVDDGEDRTQDLDCLFAFPPQRFHSPIEPHVTFLEWLGDTLFAGFRGRHFSALLATDDLAYFEVVHATSASNAALRSHLGASRRANGECLIVGSAPGLRIDRASATPGAGLELASA